MLKNVIKKLEIAYLYIAMKTIQILKNVTNWKWLKFIGTSVTTSTLAITRGSKATHQQQYPLLWSKNFMVSKNNFDT